MGDGTLVFFREHAERLEPYLPPLPPPHTQKSMKHYGDPDEEPLPGLPWVTLTYASSLDSALSLGPGIRTTLSGPESKAMTHYLRSRHDSILVGVGTAEADDPGLNCRIDTHSYHPLLPPEILYSISGYELGELQARMEETESDARSGEQTPHQPRPLILDPSLRWEFSPLDSKVFRLASQGLGLAPFILTTVPETDPRFQLKKSLLEPAGGRLIRITPSASPPDSSSSPSKSCDWHSILRTIRSQGLKSVMVEGGAKVIDGLLTPAESSSSSSTFPSTSYLPNAVIITIAPTWLGKGSVVVSPDRKEGHEPPRLTLTRWIPLGEDVVLCGRIDRPRTSTKDTSRALKRSFGRIE